MKHKHGIWQAAKFCGLFTHKDCRQLQKLAHLTSFFPLPVCALMGNKILYGHLNYLSYIDLGTVAQ